MGSIIEQSNGINNPEKCKRHKKSCDMLRISVCGLDEDVEPDDQLLPEKIRVLEDLGLSLGGEGYVLCFCR